MSSKVRNVANTPPTDTPTTRTKRELPPLVEIDQPVEAPPVAPKKAKTDVVHELQKRNNEQKAEPQPVAPTIRIVGGELPKIGIEGVVVASEVKQGSKPKVMFTMAVKQVRANGAFDVIESGVPGFEWLLPTYKGIKASVVDASPSATATQRKEEEPRRSAVEDLGHKTIWLGYLKNATVFASNGNGEMKEGSAMIVPGMQVSATGVVANVVDEKLYLNIPNCNPKLDSVDQSRAAAMLIQEFSKDCFMKQSAILLSMTMGGFFGWNSPTAAQDVQASYFRAAWTKIRDGTASACNSKGHAAACRGDDTGAVVMEAHAERIRSYCPSEFARGTQSFFVDQRDANPEYPMFVTQLVHKVDKFGHDNMINRLFDAAAADGDGCNPSYKELPGMFASPHVGHVEVVGQLLYVKMNLSFVGCKENAMQQLMDGVDPTIDCSVGQDTKQCIATKLLLRDVGPGIAGVSIATKVAGVAESILKYGDWTMCVRVTPRDPCKSSDGVFPTLCDTIHVDIPATMRKIAVLVSEEFIIKELTGGATQYVYEPDPTTALVKGKDNGPLPLYPQLRVHGYQEVTSSSGFKLNAKTPIHLPNKHYRVWWPESTQLIQQKNDVLVDTVAGQAAVVEAASQAGFSSVCDFLLAQALVYCVAVA